MSTSEHTPGRLSIIGAQGCAIWADEKIIASVDGSRDNHKLARANARRLVACWNAFDGVPTEIVEMDDPQRLGDIAQDQQRDELIAKLTAILDAHADGRDLTVPMQAAATILEKIK